MRQIAAAPHCVEVLVVMALLYVAVRSRADVVALVQVPLQSALVVVEKEPPSRPWLAVL